MLKINRFLLLTVGLIVLIIVSLMLKPILYFFFLSYFLPDITPQMRAKQLASINRDTVAILDTRSYQEFKVSHLPGARWVGFDEFNLNKIDSLPQNTTIVLYCSVGYRSDLVGEKLLDAGYNNVFNLWGGIFTWVNNGLPVYNDNEQTDQIHPYSKKWSFWLSKGKFNYGE